MEGVNKYPVSKANQVLNHNHLNILRDYLDEQDRLTRSLLIGTGIVCGFKVEWINKDTIRISEGCGITSMGFLIHITHPENGKKSYKYYKELTPPKNYKPFENISDLFELRESSQGAKPLDNGKIDPEQMAVVLFLDYADNEIDTCVVEDCDERGTWREFTLRPLLIKLSDLLELIKEYDKDLSKPEDIKSVSDLKEEVNRKYRLPRIIMRRPFKGSVGPKNEKMRQSQITYTHIERLYISALRYTLYGPSQMMKKNLLAAAIEKAYGIYHPVFGDMVTNSEKNRALKKLEEIAKALKLDKAGDKKREAIDFIQYYYDFFKDLIDAYLLLEQIRAFEAQSDVSSLSLGERVTLLRQLHADPDLPFDEIIGTEEGDRSVEDRPELSNLVQMLKGPVTGVVLPNGEYIDFAHFIVTLDAYRHPDREVQYSPGGILPPINIGTSHAIASWSGDVGGAVAGYAVKHEDQGLSSLNSSLMDEEFEHSAPDADLLGNLDGLGAYLLTQQQSGISTLEQLVRLYYEGVSSTAPQGDPDALHAHRAAAITEFLGSYGFTIATNLGSPMSALRCIVTETYRFSVIWYMNRRGFSTSTLSPPFNLLMRVSAQMALRFLRRMLAFANRYGVTTIPPASQRSVICPAPSPTPGSGGGEETGEVQRKLLDDGEAQHAPVLNAPLQVFHQVAEGEMVVRNCEAQYIGQ